jgi:hypothetical protein
MKYTKALLTAGLALALAAPVAVANATTTTKHRHHRHSINHRERNQQKRIGQGLQSGQLTPKEAAKLENKENRIENREARMRASGGKFTPGERNAIQHQLNNESKDIYRQKHDAQQQH